MKNIPNVNLGLIAVSRDCFPIDLSRQRKIEVIKQCSSKNIDVVELDTIVENETDTIKALKEASHYLEDKLNLFKKGGAKPNKKNVYPIDNKKESMFDKFVGSIFHK